MRLFSFKDLLVLFLGIIAITLQLFFLPFHVWDAGVARPWYMMHDLIPYKDFVWIRMPFDLFLLETWYKIFGANGFAYQLFIYALLVILSIAVFVCGRLVLKKFYFLPFLFFNIFLFPLFQNTEEGEILVGIFNILLFLTVFFYFKKRNIWYLFIAGLISGLSFITKQNSVLVAGALTVTLLLDFYLQRAKFILLINRLGVYFSGIIIPILGIILYFSFHKSLEDFFYYTLFFILGTYSKAQVNQGNGLLIVFSFLSLLIPFVFVVKKVGVRLQSGLFLILQIVALFPSLLPSFLSYRAFTAFPLISIVAGVLLTTLIRNKIGKVSKVAIVLAFVSFLFFNYTFIDSYISSIANGEIKYGQYITSYGKKELEIAELIRKNSSKDEKIISYGNEMIYVLSDRLPANKYVDPFPYLLHPYEETSKVFIDNPPKLVVYDESLPRDHIGLDKWPFIDFLHKNYDILQRFDSGFVLYKYKKL
ncbi:MAG: hypothetical protein HYW62_02265 [Candidatus Levybacteria bacterium]|nr:hypothetical protein [Candidatus Levybacteria bacterium]